MTCGSLHLPVYLSLSPQSGEIVLMTEALCLIRSMQPPKMNVKRADKDDKVLHP